MTIWTTFPWYPDKTSPAHFNLGGQNHPPPHEFSSWGKNEQGDFVLHSFSLITSLICTKPQLTLCSDASHWKWIMPAVLHGQFNSISVIYYKTVICFYITYKYQFVWEIIPDLPTIPLPESYCCEDRILMESVQSVISCKSNYQHHVQIIPYCSEQSMLSWHFFWLMKSWTCDSEISTCLTSWSGSFENSRNVYIINSCWTIAVYTHRSKYMCIPIFFVVWIPFTDLVINGLIIFFFISDELLLFDLSSLYNHSFGICLAIIDHLQ